MKLDHKTIRDLFFEQIKKLTEGVIKMDIYTKQGINSCIEDDEISCAEEAFMLGYLES